MLQRLAIAIYLLTMTARAIYCACGEGGDPFPLADGEIFSSLAKLTPLNRKYFTGRDKLLIFTVIA
ncbi:hypothetical protein GTI83_11945 [Klebsiella pneumoniae]|uniref:hypothetical protein n=1 Tax=Klebsiella pneumoniae TaxID=573 RepID=UPI00135F6CE6|nr:hypothetical protein [Klebsiella pneumoniae]MXR90516.1 hypothetical protein [Klebsiella pneumoniae]MXS56744.1 hypothetical protein [Klebsiella pneumoniae]HBQ2246788.1 hypothetical protein [Klebsiella pneumoniae]